MDLSPGQLIKAPFRSARGVVKAFGVQCGLYLATGDRTEEPQLHRIHDPAGVFRVGQDVSATGFIVREATWWEGTGND